MSVNFPGPYEVEIRYRVVNFLHVMRLSCIVTNDPLPGTIPANVSVLTRGGQPRSLTACVDDFWAQARAAFSNSVTAEGYTLWKYKPVSYVRDYVTAGTIASPTGSRTQAPVLASQAVLTLRTAGGGYMKVTFLEHVEVSNDVLPYSSTAPNWWHAVSQFLVSINGFAVGRDNTFPITGIRASFGQNESVWRKRYRVN